MTGAESVAAAAEWMDKNHPGWETRVNPGTLDVMSPCRCVLGQAVGWSEWRRRVDDGTVDRFVGWDEDHLIIMAFATRNAEPFWQDEISKRLGQRVKDGERESIVDRVREYVV